MNATFGQKASAGSPTVSQPKKPQAQKTGGRGVFLRPSHFRIFLKKSKIGPERANFSKKCAAII